MTKKSNEKSDLDFLEELLGNKEDPNFDEKKIEDVVKKLEEKLANLNSKKPLKKKKSSKKKKEKLVMPLEEYAAKYGVLTANQERSIRDYKASAFPELYENTKFNDDVDSKTPVLALTKPAKILSSLFQIQLTADKKNKILN